MVEISVQYYSPVSPITLLLLLISLEISTKDSLTLNLVEISALFSVLLHCHPLSFGDSDKDDSPMPAYQAGPFPRHSQEDFPRNTCHLPRPHDLLCTVSLTAEPHAVHEPGHADESNALFARGENPGTRARSMNPNSQALRRPLARALVKKGHRATLGQTRNCKKKGQGSWATLGT